MKKRCQGLPPIEIPDRFAIEVEPVIEVRVARRCLGALKCGKAGAHRDHDLSREASVIQLEKASTAGVPPAAARVHRW